MVHVGPRSAQLANITRVIRIIFNFKHTIKICPLVNCGRITMRTGEASS